MGARPRVALLCHHDAPLHSEGMARWLASWAELVGIVVIHEPRGLLWKRVRREWRRVGLVRLADVLAFRAYYRARLAARDVQWMRNRLERLRADYPPLPADVPVLHTRSPNSAEAETFLRACAPELSLALCKNLLAERIFAIPALGTFVLHPGICPEYRNAHGCFWALASDDVENVGMTLLRIDRGIDTGPIFGYCRSPYDEVEESHIVIQHRMVLDNLDAIAAMLRSIAAGVAPTIPASGRPSRAWGQPWLSRYARWKWQARRRARARARGRHHAGDHPAVS